MIQSIYTYPRTPLWNMAPTRAINHAALALLLTLFGGQQLFAQCGGGNLAIGKQTYASTEESSDQGFFPSENAADGNGSTRWASKFENVSNPDQQWWYVDLGQTYDVCQVIIKWEQAFAEDYNIIYSNGGSFNVLKTVTNNGSDYNSHTNLNTQCRYIGFEGISRATQYGYSIYEFEVYGTNSTPLPDLTVTGMNAPNLISAGSFFSASATLRNVGNANYVSSSSNINRMFLFLSSDPSWDHEDMLISYPYTIPSLAVNQSKGYSFTMNMPSNTITGNYYLILYVDPSNSVNELNESNNTYAVPITVQGVAPPKPDYVPLNFSLSTTNVSPGQEISGNLFVKNNGSGAATVNSRGKYYYSNNSTLDGSDPEIGNDDIEALAPGQQTPESEAITIPGSAQQGTRYILYKVDADNQIDESNESNNVASVAITVVPYPDLVVQNASVTPNTGGPGTSVNVSCRVANVGNGYAGVSQVGYYFSSNNSYDGGDIPLGFDNVSDMGAGGSSSENATFSIPSAGPGTYYILFRADNQNVIAESNDNNNLASAVFTLGSPPSANFSAAAQQTCQGDALSFINQSSGANAYAWSFSPSTITYVNGSSSSSANPQVQFNVPGTYTVSLTASNAVGNDTETKNGYITVEGPTTPTVSITASQNNVCQGALISFSPTISGGGTAPSYQWKVNGNVVSTNAQFSSTALNNGDQVQLTLASSRACASPGLVSSNTLVMSINSSVTPTVSIVPSANNLCPGESITFVANVNGGGDTPAYDWRVNGSTQGNQPSFSRTNFSNGDQVQLIITSSAACANPTTATSNTVVVQVASCPDPPVAAFTPTTATLCPGESVQFTNQSTGEGNAYQWSFPGGTPATSTAISPAVTYSSAGTYSVTLVATNEAGSHTAQGTITVQSSCGPDWPITTTGENHTVIVQATTPVMIDGMPVAPGDYLGVYYLDGATERYAGKAAWNGQNISLTVYGDDNGTPQKDGYSPGESFKWRLWKASTEETYEATATYQPVDAIISDTDQFVNNGLSSLASLMGSAEEQQDMVLQPGWNTISSYIQAEDPDLASIFEAIRDVLVLVKNGEGQIYFPASNINTIGDWDVTRGYKVKVMGNTPQTLTITGTRVTPAMTPIRLRAGWNLIAYLRDVPQPLQLALASLGSKVILVKDNGGNIYSPGFGIDNIGEMQPGQGYQLRMASEGVLTYEQASRNGHRISSLHRAQMTPHHYQVKLRTGTNASFFLQASPLLHMGDELGVFAPTGELVGAAVYEGHTLAFPIWGAEAEGTPGLQAGDALDVRIWRNGNETRLPQLEFQGGQTYQPDGLIQARLAAWPDLQVQLYPNPTQGLATLRFALETAGPVSVEVLNMTGQRVQRLLQAPREAGLHEQRLNFQELPEGLYQLRILLNGRRKVLPISVLRH